MELTRAAPLGAATFDAKSRTASAVLASSTPVHRFFGRPDGGRGQWVEVLPADKVDLSRIRGASLLLDHAKVMSQRIGVVEDAVVSGDQIIGKLRFSSRAEVEPLLADIAEFGAQISTGYHATFGEPDDLRAAVPTYRATSWTPLEASLVAVAADSNARIRSLERNMSMDDDALPGTPAPEAEAPESRGGQTNTTESPTVDPVLAAERRRVEDLLRAGKTLKLESEAMALIRAGTDTDRALTTLFEEAAKRDEANQIVRRPAVIQAGGRDESDPALWNERAVDALFAVATSTAPSERARDFMRSSPQETVREIRLAAERRYQGPSRRGTWQTRSGSGFHTVSDFPQLLAATGDRILLSAYEIAQPPLKKVARRRAGGASDFRNLSTLRFGGVSGLEPVAEHGEVTRGTAHEQAHAYQVGTFGRIHTFTFQAQQNDDLSALNDWVRLGAQQAGQREGLQLISVLTDNAGVGPTMDDGNPLFHTAHGNLATSAGAPDETRLSAARVAMRRQTDLDGTTPILVEPQYIVLPPELETTTEKLLSTVQATATSDVNVFANKLRMIVEPGLPNATQWYLFAEPTRTSTLEYAWLNDVEGPQVTFREGFDILGIEFRIVMFYGCGAIDWRGAFRNAG